MLDRTTTGEDGEQLTRGYSGRLLLSLSSGYLVIQFGRYILSPLLPAIIEDLEISPFLAGTALTLLTGAYALAMYPGGRLADGLNRKTVLVSALVIAIHGTGIISVSSTYPPFACGVVVFGVGAGLYWISLRALLADLFENRRGQAFGIQDALGFVGPIFAAGIAVVVLATTTWRMVFPVQLGIFAVLSILAHRWIRSGYEISRVRLNVLETGARVFGDGHVSRLVLAYSCVVFSMQAVMGFLPTFLQVEKGFSPTFASVGFGVLFLGAALTMPISGHLGDRVRYAPVAVGGLALSILGLATSIVADSRILLVSAIFVFGVGAWAFPPVIQAHLMARFPDESMGGDFGAFKTVYAAVGSLGPAYVGSLAEVSSYELGFAGLIPPLVAGIVLVAKTS